MPRCKTCNGPVSESGDFSADDYQSEAKARIEEIGNLKTALKESDANLDELTEDLKKSHIDAGRLKVLQQQLENRQKELIALRGKLDEARKGDDK